MDNILKFLQNMKKSYQNTILIAMVITINYLLGEKIFANDICWIISMGKFIINNGFPITDPLTFHSGLSISVQQWGFDVVCYYVYHLGGIWGINLFVVLVTSCTYIFIYILCIKLSDGNKIVSIIIALFSSVFLFAFSQPRPQIVSQFIFLLTIYFLENLTFRINSYERESTKKIIQKNYKYFLIIPILSLLLINFHAAMWPFFFFLMLPYILEALIHRHYKIKSPIIEIKNAIPYSIILIISFLFGFLNPYSYHNMLYSLVAENQKTLVDITTELHSPNFKDSTGISIFILIMFIFLTYTFYKKGTSRFRYILITIGMLYAGLSSIRSLNYFVMSAMPFLAYYLRNMKLPDFFKIYGKSLQIFLIFIFGMFAIIQNLFYLPSINNRDDIKLKSAVNYIKSDSNLTALRIYNEYETGGFLELNSIKPFIDSRAEVFVKALNKKESILEDYRDVLNGKLYYKSFIKKYKFEFFLVSKGTLLDTYIKEDIAYKLVYSDKYYCIYTQY